MVNRISDYFPTSPAPDLVVKNIQAPPASAKRPDDEPGPALAAAMEILTGLRIAILTGAGISTESGLPDYRSPGSPPRSPITIQQYMADERWRRHYWARNHVGWKGPHWAKPNRGHTACVQLEARGITTGVITQNVDRLHSRAGSRRVVDLHGRFDQVICTKCGDLTSREELARRLDALNPHWVMENVPAMEIAPDADATVIRSNGFHVADCAKCGGIIRTNVVFFGGTVEPEVVAAGREIVGDAEALLVAGSSLAVASAMRFVRQAHREGKPIVIVNRGATRGDEYADLRIHLGTSETLDYLATHLSAPTRT